MIINCKKLAEEKLLRLKHKIEKYKSSLQLDILYVKKNTASEIFIKHKKKIGDRLGIKVKVHVFKKNTSPRTIQATCNHLNLDPNCTGYFIQLPLRENLMKANVLDCIAPHKDIDCLTSTNLGKASKGTQNALRPATVESILFVLKYLGVPLQSQRITIVNDSNLIGKPLASCLLSKDATVTVCNKFTKYLDEFTHQAQILITAAGQANLIKSHMIMEDCIVIDAGITKYKGKVTGDVDTLAISKKAKAVTPVPGGIGPLTIACLFENLVKVYALEKQRPKTS